MTHLLFNLRFLQRICLAFIVTALLATGTHVAHAASRKAFVVGISNYLNLQPPLLNARVDAENFAAKLKSAGYETTTLFDEEAASDPLFQAWDNFLVGVHEGDEVVLYYSGHGLSIDGNTQLIAQDSPPPSKVVGKYGLTRSLISLNKMMMDLADRNVAIQVWIVDACRVNPYVLPGRSFLSTSGLRPEVFFANQFVFYSANYGQVAADRLPQDEGKALGSPFARILLEQFDSGKELSIADYAKKVRLGLLNLLADTTGDPQFPVFEDGIVGTWCLATCSDKLAQNTELPANNAIALANSRRTAVNDEREKQLVNSLASLAGTSIRPPTNNNSVYLGKKSAILICRPGSFSDALPFGCEAAQKFLQLSAGRIGDIEIPTASTIAARTEVNVRKSLPTQVGNQLFYECKVGMLSPGDHQDVSRMFTYKAAGDTFFFATLQGRPMTNCEGAVDLLASLEGLPKSAYDKSKYNIPYVSLDGSVTIGLDYNLGYVTKEQMRADLSGLLDNAMVDALEPAVGIRDKAAAAVFVAQWPKDRIIPYETAKAILIRNMDKFGKLLLESVPRAAELNGSCFGAVAITLHNVGSFERPGPRGVELKKLKKAIEDGHQSEIPKILRSIGRTERLPGLRRRREMEAALCEKSLHQ